MADFLKGLTRAGVEQGLGMGWGDEAEAWLRSKLGDRSYEDLLKQIHQEQGKFAEEHPVIQPMAELVGGAAPMVASYMVPGAQAGAPVTTAKTLGTLAKIAENPYIRGAVTGAGLGAVSGAGSAEPDQRLSGAVSGSVLGGGLGATIPAAVRSAGGIGDFLRERMNPSESFINQRAASKLSTALEQSGLTPKDIEAKMTADRLSGVPSVVANVDQGLADLAETVAQRTGSGARTIEDALLQQKLGARERAYQQIHQRLNPKDYYAEENNLVSSLRNKAKNLYEDAYAVGEVNDPKINAVLSNPTFKGFYDKARQIADAEALAAKLRGEDPNKYKLKDVYQVDKEGNAVLTQNPDVRTLDYIKRGIDASIESGYKGQGMSTAEASALKDLRKVFVNALDENVPEYKAARGQYAGDMEVLDALRSGMNDFRKLDHEEIIKKVADMTPAEKEAFRSGVTRNLYSQIMNPSGNFNAAQRVIGSPETQAKLQPLFDNPGQFRLFKHAMERESQLFNQSNKILGGSQTGKRMQMREEFEQSPGASEFVANAVTGGFGNSLSNIALKAIRNTEMTEKTASKLADMLMGKDPHKVAATVKMLEDYASREAPRAAKLKTTEAGLIGGSAASVFPAPSTGEQPKSVEESIATTPDIQGPDIEEAIAADREKSSLK